ncbi:MAG: FecR domain-containing protein [Rhodoferax sp.]|nr:FecR domain-containing protein [Rhodoferax sp.]
MVMNFKIVATCALVLATAVAHAQEQRTGTLKTVTGEVRLSQGATARAAQEGGGLSQADRIVTGRDASATFMLKDGSVISVGPNSTLELAKVQFDTTTQDGGLMLNLLQGTIRVVTGWLGKLHPEQVKVTTPTSVVGVRGTDFIVEVP